MGRITMPSALLPCLLLPLRGQLKELENSLAAYACASAEGMKDNGDALHFSSAALREFGIRYAKRFLVVTERDKVSEPGVAP